MQQLLFPVYFDMIDDDVWTNMFFYLSGRLREILGSHLLNQKKQK